MTCSFLRVNILKVSMVVRTTHAFYVCLYTKCIIYNGTSCCLANLAGINPPPHTSYFNNTYFSNMYSHETTVKKTPSGLWVNNCQELHQGIMSVRSGEHPKLCCSELDFGKWKVSDRLGRISIPDSRFSLLSLFSVYLLLIVHTKISYQSLYLYQSIAPNIHICICNCI